MKTIKSRTALACEYVGQGSFFKHTLVNMYTSGDIIVQSFPALIPIAFYIEIEVNFSGTHEIEAQVIYGKKVIAKLTAEFEFEEGKLGLITLPQLPVRLDGPSEIKVTAKSAEIKTTTLIKKRFVQGEIPNAPSVSAPR